MIVEDVMNEANNTIEREQIVVTEFPELQQDTSPDREQVEAENLSKLLRTEDINEQDDNKISNVNIHLVTPGSNEFKTLDEKSKIKAEMEIQSARPIESAQRKFVSLYRSNVSDIADVMSSKRSSHPQSR